MMAASPTAIWPAAGRPIDDKPFDPRRPRVTLAATRYALVGRLGRGAGSDVYLARRDERLTERVILYALRNRSNEDLLRRTFNLLTELAASGAQGADHFTRLLPQPVALGPVTAADRSARLGAAYRVPDGFHHSIEDLRGVYPTGVAPEHGVWLGKRVLELLGWLHRAGWVHGAVAPEHAMVHPRDHGVILVGWSASRPLARAESLRVRARALRPFYPEAEWAGAAMSPRADLVMLARTLAYAMGAAAGSVAMPEAVPAPLAGFIREAESGRFSDALLMKEQLDAVARTCFGPPRFHKLNMPGWR
ncbi:MAG: hypothetical protein JNK72_27190 [Myxococcales bacterium]|nr:hypothetical protein [Myxococcales bacterium]